MFVLDTDTLTLLLRGNTLVSDRMAQAAAEVVLTIVTRLEILQGRFASVFKAEDGKKLLFAQQRLLETERDLEKFTILTVDAAAAAEFDRLRSTRVKRIGRCDLLIAAITMANRAVLVTRNEKDLRRVPGLRIENWAD
jgi:tRNA(fMet)-specific endonuclease VapC